MFGPLFDPLINFIKISVWKKTSQILFYQIFIGTRYLNSEHILTNLLEKNKNI